MVSKFDDGFHDPKGQENRSKYNLKSFLYHSYHLSHVIGHNLKGLQEVFHVYLNKIEIAVSHLFLIIFSNNKFTLVNSFSRNGQSPRK